MSLDPEATTTATAMRLEGVTRTFGEGHTRVDAVADADLDVAAGETVVVLGPSGSGKTTLLNMIGGIDQPPRASCTSRASGRGASTIAN